MKIINKVSSVIALIIGSIAVFNGLLVLTGIYVPEHEYYNTLVIYNVLMGIISLLTGFLIWNNMEWAIPLSAIITIFHFLVLILLLTVFSNNISSHSINIMTIRSLVWLALLFAIGISESKRKRSELYI